MSVPQVYDVNSALAVLPISRNKLYQILENGELKATKCGTKWLITEPAIESYLGLETESPAERELDGTVESVVEAFPCVGGELHAEQ